MPSIHLEICTHRGSYGEDSGHNFIESFAAVGNSSLSAEGFGLSLELIWCDFVALSSACQTNRESRAPWHI